MHKGCNVRSKYTIKHQIGHGSYGIVVLGTNRQSKQECAIKIIDKNILSQKDELGFAQREVEILRDVEHPHIVKVHEFFEDEMEICICMEMLNGGDILDRLKLMKRPFTANETKKHLLGIFQAVSYLHFNKIAHRDLKPENMIFASMEKDAPLKLIDFGFSKSLRKHGALSSPCGTLGYSSKELVVDACQRRTYTTAVDMFALGCVAYCMLFADPPFLSEDSDDEARAVEIERKVELGIYEFPEAVPLSVEGRDFVERLLATNPEDRMTAFEAMTHSWLTDDTMEPEPKHPSKRNSLTEERSERWLLQNTHIPIETFKRCEIQREKHGRSSEKQLYSQTSTHTPTHISVHPPTPTNPPHLLASLFVQPSENRSILPFIHPTVYLPLFLPTYSFDGGQSVPVVTVTKEGTSKPEKVKKEKKKEKKKLTLT